VAGISSLNYFYYQRLWRLAKKWPSVRVPKNYRKTPKRYTPAQLESSSKRKIPGLVQPVKNRDEVQYLSTTYQTRDRVTRTKTQLATACEQHMFDGIVDKYILLFSDWNYSR